MNVIIVQVVLIAIILPLFIRRLIDMRQERKFSRWYYENVTVPRLKKDMMRCQRRAEIAFGLRRTVTDVWLDKRGVS